MMSTCVSSGSGPAILRSLQTTPLSPCCTVWSMPRCAIFRADRRSFDGVVSNMGPQAIDAGAEIVVAVGVHTGDYNPRDGSSFKPESSIDVFFTWA